MRNASVIEILWTLVALAGFVLSLFSWWQARGDLAFLLRNNYNGKRKITGSAHRRRELLRSFTQGLFAVVGVAAMFRPEPTRSSSWPLALLLTSASALIVINTALDIRTKKKLADYWKTVDLSHVADRDRQIQETTATLARIEEAGVVAAETAAELAEDLAQAQGRADEVDGVPGEAADAASRSVERP